MVQVIEVTMMEDIEGITIVASSWATPPYRNEPFKGIGPEKTNQGNHLR